MHIGESAGVTYNLGMPVSSIILTADGSRAIGVQLEDGTSVEADVVICNADLIYSYRNLLPESRMAKSLSSRNTSCSSISFYWSMDRIIPEFGAHK